MANFFDFHIHPVLKYQFASDTAPTNPWEDILDSDLLTGLNALEKCLLKALIQNSLVSQSSLSQLTNNDYKLVCSALFFPDEELINFLYNNNKFRKIIDDGKFAPILTKEKFQKFQDKNTSRYQVLKHELKLLKENQTNKEVIFLKKSTDFIENQSGTINIAFSVEGLHCLRSNATETNENTIYNDILSNLKDLKTQVPIISINLTHLDNNNSIFANQAYGMDGFRVGGLDEKNLRPTGNGLTDLGKKMIDEFEKQKIIVDIKHLSRISRKQLYDYRKEKGITSPLVCSHGGFTGCWFNNSQFDEKFTDYFIDTVPSVNSNHRKVTLSKPKPFSHQSFSAAAFNCSSINLFNEDIIEVINSKGLLGISLDQRILGYSDNKDPFNIWMVDTDFFSMNEYQQIKGIGPHGRKADPDLGLVLRSEDFDDKNNEETHFLHFVIHILQAIRMADFLNGENGIKELLLNQICLGSDFDGLIDGIDSFQNATHAKSFYDRFISDFNLYANRAGIVIPAELSINQIADRIFYENGRDFILKRIDLL